MCSTPTYMSSNRSIRRYFVGSKRRWDKYNRSLVDRVSDLLSPLFFRHWDILLKEINSRKKGRPFSIPTALIIFLSKVRAMFNVPFRSLESIARTYCILMGVKCIHYPGIFKRMRKIRQILEETPSKAVESAIDSTGFKITIRGDYLGTKWNRKRRGWKKLHAVISIKDVSVIAFTITDEHGSDPVQGRKIIDAISKKIKKLFADKAYDTKGIHNAIPGRAIIPPKRNASSQARGSPARARIVRRVKEVGEDQWKQETEYGKRWNVEIYFSGLKRTMGETIKAVKTDYIAQEIAMKVVYYNELRHMTEAY